MAGPLVAGINHGIHSSRSSILSSADADAPVEAGRTGVDPGGALETLSSDGRFNVVPSWEQTVLGDLVDSFGAVTWWERIHVTPYARDFGFHLATALVSVYVWNASRLVSRTSYEYDVDGEDGVSVSSPPTFPLHFPVGFEYEFTVEVSEDGAPNFENNVIFRFPGFTDAESDAFFEGVRVVPFPVDPSGFISEGYRYLTRIITSMSDAEQRAALRSVPVRTWSFDFVLTERDMRIASALIYGWSSRPFGLPIWYEETELDVAVSAGATSIQCDTDLRDWHELALLRLNSYTYEAILIEDVNSNGIDLGNELLNDWPEGTKVYPVRLARVDPTSALNFAGLESANGRIVFRGEDWNRTADA